MNLVVIGGGPAGASAAIMARRAGIHVIILEELCLPRARPGETLHPGIEPILSSVGAHAIIQGGNYVRHPGVWLQWGRKNEYIPFGSDVSGPWHGFQVSRQDFDLRLLAIARQQGAQIYERTKARSALMMDDRVIGIQTSDGPFYADFILDASGSNHWLARSLGIPILRHSPKLIARYGYVQGTPGQLKKMPCMHAAGEGWTWMADLGQGRYAWTRVTRPENRPVNEWVPQPLQGMTHCGSHGADVTWRMPAQTAGAGWFLCGDAAAVLDPSSSHGILRAMMSGILAAYFITLVQAGTATRAGVASAYQQWQVDWFESDTRNMAAAYRDTALFGF